MTNDEINLRPYLEFLGKNIIRVILLAALFTAIVLGVAFLMPSQYRATAVIVTPVVPGADAPPTFQGQASPLTVLQGVGESLPVMQAVSKGSGISTQDLRGLLDYREDAEFGQLVIVATTRKKEQSKKVVELALNELRTLSGKLSLSLGDQQTGLLRETLDREEKELAALEEEFRKVQEQFETVPDTASPLVNFNYVRRLKQIDIELGAVRKKIESAEGYIKRVTSAAPNMPTGDPARETYRNRVVQLEYDLQVALTKYGDKAPEVEALRREIGTARRLFVDEMKRRQAAADANLDPELANLMAEEAALQWTRETLITLSKKAPEEALKFSRMLRQIKAQQTTADTVREQYEQAKLKSEFYRLVWTVLQEPTVEQTPSNKRYSLIAVLAFSIGLILSVVIHCGFAKKWSKKKQTVAV